jgi:hypothetical protein
MLRIFANYYIFFIYYLYLSWFDSKSLFVIARYSLRYSFLASEKKMPLFAIARYLKLWSNPTTKSSATITSYASSSSAVRSCCHRHRKQLLQHSPPQQHAQHSSTQQPIPTTRTALVGAGGLSLGAPAVVAQTSPGWASCSSTATSAPDGAAAQPRARDGGSARVAGTGEAGPPARPRAGRWG